MLAKPISEYAHDIMTRILKGYKIKNVLDIGGTGKLKNRGFRIKNANKRQKLDGRNLPFKNKSFDATVSINTLEHVGNEIEQIKFLNEAKRIAKIVSVHYFPINQEAEDFLKNIGHWHPCIVPNEKVMRTVFLEGYLIADILTVAEHFLLLATMYPKLNIPELYDYIEEHGQETFSRLIILKK